MRKAAPATRLGGHPDARRIRSLCARHAARANPELPPPPVGEGRG